MEMKTITVEHHKDAPEGFTGRLKETNHPHLNLGRYIYMVDGKWHKENGPAVVWDDGSVEYWLNDSFMPKEKYLVKTSTLGKLIWK